MKTRNALLPLLSLITLLAGADNNCGSQGLNLAQASCGDRACNGEETCMTCALDCGSCNRPICGDQACNGREFCGNCSLDCGPCPGTDCGDGLCNNSETCANCDNDCRCQADFVCQAPGACVPSDIPRDGGVDAVSDAALADGQTTDTAVVDNQAPDTVGVDVTVNCNNDCDNLYTECTCGPTDPCGWKNDGVCDLLPPTESCAMFAKHFDDSDDCSDCRVFSLTTADFSDTTFFYDPWLPYDFHFVGYSGTSALTVSYESLVSLLTFTYGQNSVLLTSQNNRSLGLDLSLDLFDGCPSANYRAFAGELQVFLPETSEAPVSIDLANMSFREVDSSNNWLGSDTDILVTAHITFEPRPWYCAHWSGLQEGETYCAVFGTPVQYGLLECTDVGSVLPALIHSQICTNGCSTSNNTTYSAYCD